MYIFKWGLGGSILGVCHNEVFKCWHWSHVSFIAKLFIKRLLESCHQNRRSAIKKTLPLKSARPSQRYLTKQNTYLKIHWWVFVKYHASQKRSELWVIYLRVEKTKCFWKTVKITCDTWDACTVHQRMKDTWASIYFKGLACWLPMIPPYSKDRSRMETVSGCWSSGQYPLQQTWR